MGLFRCQGWMEHSPWRDRTLLPPHKVIGACNKVTCLFSKNLGSQKCEISKNLRSKNFWFLKKWIRKIHTTKISNHYKLPRTRRIQSLEWKKNVEVYDFAKQLSTPCSSRAILQTSAGFLGKWYSNDSGFNPLGIYINIVMTSIGYIESEIPFEIHSGEGQVGQSVSKWNAVSTSFFDER